MKYHTEPATTAMWWAANEETHERIVGRRFRQGSQLLNSYLFWNMNLL
ncbi:hypothetical protein [Natronorubrum sp. FCH18a]